jgi:hypothetical protein
VDIFLNRSFIVFKKSVKFFQIFPAICNGQIKTFNPVSEHEKISSLFFVALFFANSVSIVVLIFFNGEVSKIHHVAEVVSEVGSQYHLEEITQFHKNLF